MRKAQGYPPRTPSNPLLAASQCQAWFLVALSWSSGGAVSGADLSCAHMTCMGGLEAFSPSVSCVPSWGAEKAHSRQTWHSAPRAGVLALWALSSHPQTTSFRPDRPLHGPPHEQKLVCTLRPYVWGPQASHPITQLCHPSSVPAHVGFSPEGTRLVLSLGPRTPGSDPCP